MQQFRFEKTQLEGLFQIDPLYATDERGGLVKDYHVETFRKSGIDFQLQEVFYTISKKGVIRANHFQLVKPQAKLVRCIAGHIYDVVVDLRFDSPTYKKWQGFHLKGDKPKELLIPGECSHGYLVLEDSVVSYKCNEMFLASGDSGIAWDDPDLAIKWPLDLIGGREQLIISEKDKELMSFREFEDNGGFSARQQ